MPNGSLSTNDQTSPNEARRDERIARVMAAFDVFMHRLAATHATEFTEVGLTMSQAKVLYVIQTASAPLRMSELSARLGVTLSTTSGIVDRLVEAGLVDRRDDAADRRQVILSLTDAGTSRLDRMRELNADHMRRMLTHVSDRDLPTLERAIRIFDQAAARVAEIPDPVSASVAPSRKDPS